MLTEQAVEWAYRMPAQMKEDRLFTPVVRRVVVAAIAGVTAIGIVAVPAFLNQS